MRGAKSEAPALAGARRFGADTQEVSDHSATPPTARKPGVHLSHRSDHRHYAVERQAAMIPAVHVLLNGNRAQRRAAVRELEKRAASGDTGAAAAIAIARGVCHESGGYR